MPHSFDTTTDMPTLLATSAPLRRALAQIGQSIRDALHRTHCLVIETDQSEAIRPLLTTLAHQRREAAYLNFACYRQSCIQIIMEGRESYLPSIRKEWLHALRRTTMVFADEIDPVMEDAPHLFSHLMTWCTINLPLMVVVTPDASLLLARRPPQVSIAVDRLVLFDVADESEAREAAHQCIRMARS